MLIIRVAVCGNISMFAIAVSGGACSGGRGGSDGSRISIVCGRGGSGISVSGSRGGSGII